jgi:transcription initiation factor TFIIIB Brf1 subunit/transcription initiation factor TFIIB
MDDGRCEQCGGPLVAADEFLVCTKCGAVSSRSSEAKEAEQLAGQDPSSPEPSEPEVADAKTCPDCGGALGVSHGHIVCTGCGVVILQECVPPTPPMGEKQQNDSLSATSHVSLGNRMHVIEHSGLGSYIGDLKDTYFQDADGEVLSGEAQKRFKRLKTIYSTRVRIGKNEAKYRALRTLNHVSKLLMLSEHVRDRTAVLYKQVVADHRQKVTNNILLISACLFHAVKESKDMAPITLDEIVDVLEKCGHRVTAKAIMREGERIEQVTGTVLRPRSPADFIPRAVSMLVHSKDIGGRAAARGWALKEYEQNLQTEMVDLFSKIGPKERSGLNPFNLAASGLYVCDRRIAAASGRKPVLTLKLTSAATGVPQYTIRDNVKRIRHITGWWD